MLLEVLTGLYFTEVDVYVQTLSFNRDARGGLNYRIGGQNKSTSSRRPTLRSV
jgi:hypothetical protein